ncbi:PstC family ABC transporter permease [Streptomyces sp. L7]
MLSAQKGSGRTEPRRPVLDPPPRRPQAARGLGDRVFRYQLTATGVVVLGIMAAVGLFLLLRATQALRATGPSFLTTAQWQPDVHKFGIAAVLTGTLLIAAVAVTISVPLAVGTALFISDVAPRGLRRTLVSLVDLMAAVPSVVYGLWGLFFLQAHVIGLSRWLSGLVRLDPAVQGRRHPPRRPARLRERLHRVRVRRRDRRRADGGAHPVLGDARGLRPGPGAGEREGAYALGATRWGMIRAVVCPTAGRHHRPLDAGARPGDGRDDRRLHDHLAGLRDPAAHPADRLQLGLLLIALHYGDASSFGMSALMAAGRRCSCSPWRSTSPPPRSRPARGPARRAGMR